jgi:uncharacterized protein (DUF433 family)
MPIRPKASRLPAQVISDKGIMGGQPVVAGTRVPAETIVAYLRAGRTAEEIFEDYPSLPVDGIEAVINWADDNLGPGWRNEKPHR